MVKARRKKKVERKGAGRSPRSGMGRDIAAVVMMAAALVLGLALLTFAAGDGRLVARGLPTASNLVGPVGHEIARDSYRLLGFAALVVPVALVVFGWKLLHAAPPRITLVAFSAYLVLALSVATLAHLALAPRHLTSFPPGGVVGRLLSTRAEVLFSTVGAAILVATCALVAAIVAVDLQLRQVVGLFTRGSQAVAGFLGAHLARAMDEHRQAVAELRATDALTRARRAEAEAEALAAAETEGLAIAPAPSSAAANEADPAWAVALAGVGSSASAPPVEKRARRRHRSTEDEPQTVVCDATDHAPLEDEEAGAEEPAKGAEEQAQEPLPPATAPEIVLSPFMQERARRKKEKEEDVPAFTFTRKGDVFRLPSTDLLDQRQVVKQDVDASGLTHTAELIVATLRQHGVDGVVKHIRPGPVVTLYEFIPVAGVKLARIENLDKELTMALAAIRIRIIAPIPGKGVVGIEVPNKQRALVNLREVLETDSFAQAGGLLPLALGKDIEGIPYCVDLQRMPHLLIAGTTGSGKSVGLNTMTLSLLYRQTPDEVRFIMVDPKMTELSIYEEIPHLLLPVVVDPAKAARALQWAVDEMERRTQVLADTGSKDLRSYNGKVEKLRAEGRAFGDSPVEAKPTGDEVVIDLGAARVPVERPTGEAAERPSREDPFDAPRRGCGRRRPRRAGRATTRCSRRPSTRTRPSHPLRMRWRRARPRRRGASSRRSCRTSWSSSTSWPTS